MNYKEEPFTEFELSKIEAMVANGTTREGAEKVRWAERKRRKLTKIIESRKK